MNKPLILSTKKLDVVLRKRIVQNGLAYMEYDAIQVKPLSFESPALTDYIIFSSKNAVKTVLKNGFPLANAHVLCVGEQSKALLFKNGIKTTKTVKNMEELVIFIEKMTNNASFLHFCGNRRLPVLANKMKDWKCNFREVVVYQTELTNTKIEAAPDAILFFSPSGVESHQNQNDITNAHCFCIGNTTATAFRQTPKSIQAVKNASMEQVVAKAIHYFKLSQHA